MSVKSLFSPIWWVLKKFWWLLDGTRRALLNLLLLALIVAIVWGLATRGPKPLKDKTTLVLDLQGDIVEQFSGSPRDQALAQLRGDARHQTRLRDLLAVLDSAAKDDKLAQLVLDLDRMGSASPATLREMEAALQRFKKDSGGKPVVAFASNYDQRSYYLAAQADQVYLHPMGAVLIEGFGRYRTYYKDALDRVGVTAHVLKVGTYKNFAEPYMANGPSKASLEAEAYLWDDLWGRFQQGIEKARKLQPGALKQAIDELPQRLAAVNGNTGKLALNEKLIDGLKTRDQLKELLEKKGALDDKQLRQIRLGAYLARIPPKLPSSEGAVGVIVAEGEIVDGEAAPGKIGGESTAKLIRQAREDDKIKALVLRVNSPGGSAFASELVRRELELARSAGKPVVVSMGGVAASGGYWISTASDEIFADASTVTGSIGVVGVLPTAEKLMDKLSLRTGGYTTTWLAGGLDPRRALDPRLEAVIQGAINHTYSEFTARVAQARKKTVEEVDQVGQGRVWSGQQALERGLVDKLGRLEDAVASAAQRAKLGDKPQVRYVETERSKWEQVADSFGDALAPSVQAMVRDALRQSGVPVLPQSVQAVQGDMSWLVEQAQTGAKGRVPALAHCLCGMP